MRRYQTDIENSNISAFNKTGIAFGRREGQSIGIINSFTRHEIESAYGAKQYDGKQNTFYSNVLVSSFLVNETHKYVAGASFLYDRFDETYSDTLAKNSVNTPMPIRLAREDIVPGAFAQYTYSFQEKLTVMAGVRGDYHNRYGMLFTPRANVKYNFTNDIIFRVSAGRGYRSANVIAENIGYLASSRRMNVLAINDLDIEKAWNYGANLTFYIHLPEERTITVGMDYYRTDFDNQAIVDMEYDRQEIYFYNLQGKSYANAWQMDVQATPFKGFDVFAAFRLSDTRVTYSHNGQRFTADKPLSSKFRGLLNFSYATNFEKWKIDVTAQFNGSSRLPGLSEGGYSAAQERSPAYPLYFAQITKKTKRLDIYAGCENILNYKQKNPIIEANDPFGSIFDASRIWGPLMGRKFYAGIRLRIGEIK
jgi:outer membrane receptor for ferrienterochelin and colicin